MARDIVEWHRLRAGEGSAAEVLDFLARRPDWPGLPYLREQNETAFDEASRKQVAAFFDYGDAQDPQGVLIQARALEKRGQRDAAQVLVVNAWKTMAIGPQTHQKFLDRYGKLLKPHHTARMDMVLWKGWTSNTNRMMPLMSADWKKLAQARSGLRQQVNGVDGLVAAVPATLKGDPGLAYERFVWRARKGLTASAIDLLVERSEAQGRWGKPKTGRNAAGR